MTPQAVTLLRYAAEASAEADAWEAAGANPHLVTLRRRDAALLERRAKEMAGLAIQHE